MAEYILRPNSDDKAEWTETPAGAAWAVLNEVVTEADTPDTSNNYIDTTVDGQIARCGVENVPILPREIVYAIEGWAYVRASTTGQGVNITLVFSSGTSAAASVAAGTGFGWVKTQLVPPGSPGGATQADLDGLLISAASTGTATSGSSRVAAMFCRVFTMSTQTPRRMPLGA